MVEQSLSTVISIAKHPERFSEIIRHFLYKNQYETQLVCPMVSLCTNLSGISLPNRHSNSRYEYSITTPYWRHLQCYKGYTPQWRCINPRVWYVRLCTRQCLCAYLCTMICCYRGSAGASIASRRVPTRSRPPLWLAGARVAGAGTSLLSIVGSNPEHLVLAC